MFILTDPLVLAGAAMLCIGFVFEVLPAIRELKRKDAESKKTR